MQARKDRSDEKITTNASYFSGDERQPSNEGKSRNFSPRRPRSTKTLLSKELNKRNVLSKQNQTAETLEWLSENYELIHGVCVPRCVLYTHYLDFCKKRKFSPAGPATFGKLIRQKFPKLTTRRLGTRGQSKYHYYGISIKESSVYYHSVYSGKGLTRFSGTEGKKKGMTKKPSLDKKTRNTLPEFPKASEMILNEDLSVEKVETFIMMYRTHCQRLLDTVMNANFDEVHKFLLHFWRGMPQHMIPVLECDAVTDIIIVCDSLLYKILNDVLVPSCIQDIPDSLTEEIQDFAITFLTSLEACLENTPAVLKSRKLQVAKHFVRLLKRNMSFINLAQTARPVFLSYESMSGILNEFRCLDLRKIVSELLFLTEQENIKLPALLMFMEEFENLLVKQAPLEAYAEWFDSVVEDYVLKYDEKMDDAFDNDLSRRSQRFLTSWAFITSRILQELTLKGAPTFGSFQLIIMMFEEYILLIIENQMIAQLDENLKLGLERHLKNTGSTETSIVQNSKTHKGADKQTPNAPKQRGAYSVQDKGKQMHLLQNIEQEMQHYGNPENSQSDSYGFEVSTYPCQSFTQQNLPHQVRQLGNLAPPQDNFTTSEVYLGVNAVPSEIYRIENIRSNQAHTCNLMYTQSGEDNVDFSKVATDKNGKETLQTAGNNSVPYSSARDANHFETYNMKGQHSQGHFPGHYLTVNQGQYGSRNHQRKFIYQSDPCQDQNSNQDHFESLQNGQHSSQFYFHKNNGQGQSQQVEGQETQGHQGQGSSNQGQHGQTHTFHARVNQRHLNQGHVGYSKDCQYENQLHLHTPGYGSQSHVNLSQNLFEQNMNYCQTNDDSNYQCTESSSLSRLSSQESSLNFTDNNFQEKTSLPSFFQLSSQLSCNARLSAGY